VLSRDFVQVCTETSTFPKSRLSLSPARNPVTQGRIVDGNLAVAIVIAMIPIRAKSGRHSDPETKQR